MLFRMPLARGEPRWGGVPRKASKPCQAPHALFLLGLHAAVRVMFPGSARAYQKVSS